METKLRPWVTRLLPFALLFLVSLSAHASTQCPEQYGHKSPIVDLLGWLVVALGVVAGCAFFAWIVKWSLKLRLRMRLLVIAFGLAAMLAVWVGGFAAAFFYFFFKC